MPLLLELFLTFIMIATFSFGGGYGMLSFIQKELVFKHGWLTATEFTDMVAISQMTPGPIAVNSATYAGFKLAGLPGAIVSNIGLMIPAFVLVLIVGRILTKYHEHPITGGILAGLKPATVALLAASALSIGFQSIIDLYGVITFLIAFILMHKFKVNQILLIIIGGIIGILIL